MNQKFRVAIFASGNGSNAEEIIKYFKEHSSIQIVLVVTSNPEAYVLKRAANFHIPSIVINRQDFATTIVGRLAEYQITHIVLAGFLWLIPSTLLKAYPNKVINIHPALLPKYGGKGMYGMKIHELVRATNEKETGITIHVIDDKYDEGPIVFQAKCEVQSTDTPQQIADKVHELEYKCYPKVIEQWILNELNYSR